MRASISAGSTSTDRAFFIPETDILFAVSSLYDDELRPYGRLLRKRIAEHAAAKMCVLDGDMNRLRQACEASMWMEVRPEEGGEWCALLVGRAGSFVDIYNGPDMYPEQLWMELAQCLQKLDGEAAVLPGGRYSCACALWQLGLPCLANRSLGQVCHIVELAMSERKLLGYLDGTIAPYHRSQSMLKDTAAERNVHNATQQLPLATWSRARACLKEVLDSAVRKGKNEVPLSNLKRLFRSRFHVELSETALGYTKVSDLLQDPQLNDICRVQLLERGYVVRPRACPLSTRVHSFERTSQASNYAKGDGKMQIPRDPSFVEGAACRPQLTLLELPKREVPAMLKAACIDSVVRKTFIHAIDPASLAQRTHRRSQSIPKDFGSEWSLDTTSCVTEFIDRSSTRSGDGSSTDIPWTPTLTTSPTWSPRFPSSDGASSSHDVDAPLSPTLTASPCWSPRLPDPDFGVWEVPSLEDLDNAFVLHAMGGSFAALGSVMTSYSHVEQACYGSWHYAAHGLVGSLHADAEEYGASGGPVYFPTQPTAPSRTPTCFEELQDGDDFSSRVPLCLAHFV